MRASRRGVLAAGLRTSVGLALALAAPRAARAQDPGIDVQQYSFRIAIPDSGRVITAAATVTFRRTAPVDSLRLDLVGMGVDSVGGGAPFRYDDTTLAIPLGAAPPPRRGVVPAESLTVYYHGAPSDGLIETSDSGVWRYFGDNWPNRARHWLPTVDHPSDKARVAWRVTAPARDTVVTNLTGDRRIPTYCMVIAVAPMTVSHHRPADGRIPIDVYTYPGDSAYADSVPFRRATEIVESMERLVGPFPYARLAHLESTTRYGGMENSSAIFYADRPYQRRRMSESVVRHETAHQWFGDAVTERDWHHVWLSEGFATYFDAAIAQQLDGDSAYWRLLHADRASYLRSRDVDRPIIDSSVTDPNRLLNANSYQKGAWVLHMLRRETGDSAFFRGLRAYYLAWRDSTTLSVNLERAVEAYERRDLSWFFHQWLYQPGYPKLAVTWTAHRGAPRTVTLHIHQAQDSAWGYFRVSHVPVVFLAADSTVIGRADFMLAAGADQTVRLPVRRVPASIQIDPDGELLLTADVSPGR